MAIYDVEYQFIDFNNIPQNRVMLAVKANNEFDARTQTELQVARRENVKFVRATKAEAR